MSHLSFEAIDRDGSGAVTVDEIGRLFHREGAGAAAKFAAEVVPPSALARTRLS